MNVKICKQILLITIFLSLLFSGCSSHKGIIPDQKLEEYRTYVSTKFKDVDSTNRLDSFRLIRLDTLTQKNVVANELKSLGKELKKRNDETSSLLEEYKSKEHGFFV